MTTQQNLKQRLKTTANILNITQAMEVVASVRYRKVSLMIHHSRFYANSLSEMIQRLQFAAPVEAHPLFAKREAKKIGVIIVMGDKGLCGSYNDNVAKKAETFLAGLDPSQVELYLLGTKAVEKFKQSGWKIRRQVSDFTKNLSESFLKELTDEWMHSFSEAEIDALWIVSTDFINTLRREVVVNQVLPIEAAKIREEKNVENKAIHFIFEPDPTLIYKKIIPYFFSIQMQAFFLESYASELSSRVTAMKAAAKNAEEMIEKLTLIKNKQRQLSITREILEITAGAESLR